MVLGSGFLTSGTETEGKMEAEGPVSETGMDVSIFFQQNNNSIKA